MGEQGLLCRYVAPKVVDYGNLVEITAAAHLLMGTAGASDLSFSAPLHPGSGGDPGTADGPSYSGGSLTNGTASGGSEGAPGGGTSGGGSSGGGSAGGGKLPFTGLAAGAVAAVGSALAASGAALRRASRARRRP